MKYEQIVEIPADLPLGTLDEVVEKIRCVAHPALGTNPNNVPTVIVITWETSNDEGSPHDAWDLHVVVHELKEELHAYTGVEFKMPKPEVVEA